MNLLKICTLIVKIASVIAGLASYNSLIPPSWLPAATIAFALASVAKDAVNRIGDILDDGQSNNSFKP